MQADRPQDPLSELNRQLCEAARHEPIVHHVWDRFGRWDEVSLHVLILVLLERKKDSDLNTRKMMAVMRSGGQFVQIPRHSETIPYEDVMAKLDREMANLMGLPPDSLRSPGPPRSE